MKVKIEYTQDSKSAVVGPDLSGEDNSTRHEHLATLLYQALYALEETPAELPDRVSVHHVIAWLTAIHLYKTHGGESAKRLERDDIMESVASYLHEMEHPRGV